MQSLSDPEWPIPEVLLHARERFDQACADLHYSVQMLLTEEKTSLPVSIQRIQSRFDDARDATNARIKSEESDSLRTLVGATQRLVGQERVFRYARNAFWSDLPQRSNVSASVGAVGTPEFGRSVTSQVDAHFRVECFTSSQGLLRRLHRPDQGTVPQVVVVEVSALDPGGNELEDWVALASRSPLVFVGEQAEIEAAESAILSAASEVRVTIPLFSTVSIAAACRTAAWILEGSGEAPSQQIGPSKPAPLEVCEYVVVGSSGVEATANDQATLAIPVLARFLGKGHLVIEGKWTDRTNSLVQALVEQGLMSTGPGQLSITVVDPELRSPLAIFTALSEAADDILRPPLSDPVKVTHALDNVAEDIRRVQSTLEGRETSLAELRRDLNQPVENYQLLVVCDFPRAFTQAAVDSLVGIMRRGPQCGIAVILHHDPAVEPGNLVQRTRLEEIDDTAQKISMQEKSSASWLPGLHVDTATPSWDLPARIKEACVWVKEATAPSIDFMSCQPSEELMWDTSDKRLVATIGRDGHREVSITLGDEVDQRHNILISGAVGQGKSNLIMALVHSLAMRYPPSELELHLLDFKEGISLEPLAGSADGPPSWLPHATSLGLNSDREYGAAVLSHLVTEFDRRADLIRSHGDNISKYRAADPSHVMPRIVLIIDEFQVLFEGDDAITAAALADLERLARKGRAYGIHLVLASQTISGITALLAKQDGIFAQFPIRLALKNSPSESKAVLQQDNDEAARLRYRGQLLVNLDFGALDSNRRATVALADEHTLKKTRQEMLKTLGPGTTRPIVFDGAATASLAVSMDELSALKQRGGQEHGVFVALIGRSIDVGNPPLRFEFDESPGRHLAVIGSGVTRARESAEREDMADSIVQSAALSLALQGDASFSIVNMLSPRRASAAHMNEFLQLLGDLSEGRVRVVQAEDARGFLSDLTTSMVSQAEDVRRRNFIVAFGLEKLVRIDQPDFESASEYTAGDGLRRLIGEGPSYGMHLVASWANVRSMNQQLGFQLDGAIDGVVALQVSREEVQDLFGPHFQWAPSENRAVFLDRPSGTPPRAFIPYRSVDEVEAALLAQGVSDG